MGFSDMSINVFVDGSSWMAYKGAGRGAQTPGSLPNSEPGTGATGCGTGVTGCGTGVTGCGSGVGGVLPNGSSSRHPNTKYVDHAVNYAMGIVCSVPLSDIVDDLASVNIKGQYRSISLPIVQYDSVSQLNGSTLQASVIDLSIDAKSDKRAISKDLSLSFSAGITADIIKRDMPLNAPEFSTGLKDYRVSSNFSLKNMELSLGYKYGVNDFDLLTNNIRWDNYVTGGVQFTAWQSKSITVPISISGEKNLGMSDYVIRAKAGIVYKKVQFSLTTNLYPDHVIISPQISIPLNISSLFRK